jgi:hypothetical protein
MPQLKPGSVDDMANSMAQMIEDAMNSEWSRAYPGGSLSDQGKRDREVLFAAIAQGVLGYLQQNLASLETDVVHETDISGHKHHLNFDLAE